MLLHRGLFLPWLACLVLGGCTDRATAPYPTSPPPPISDAAVGPGDLFEVRVFGHADLSTTYQVAQDGSINFPLIGSVAVDGMTAPQLEKTLQERLADGYLKNPSVSVRV